MAYHVDIKVGELSWSFVESPDGGEVSDGVTVLGGLWFGWNIPDNGIWPAQPNPMAATLSINVPEFSAIATTVDVVDGDICTIEVRTDVDGPLLASFYGDVTDYKARARDGDLSGVTLSVVAVDYTVRLAEKEAIPYPDDTIWVPGIPEKEALNAVWDHSHLGPDVEDVWTSPDPRYMGPLDNTASVKVLDFINAVLLQAVNVEDGTRMILAPRVSPTGFLRGFDTDPPLERMFTLDTVTPSVEDPFEPPAAAVRRDDLEWANIKGRQPGIFIGLGWGVDAEGRVQANVDGPGNVIQELRVSTYAEADAQDTVDFYAARPFDSWQVDRATIEITRAQREGIDVDIPTGLFPDWTAEEGEPARAACYSRRVIIHGVSPTRTPSGSSTIEAFLTGAELRIAGGLLTLTLGLRRPDAEAIAAEGYTFGPYAVGPYADLVTNP